MEYGTGAFWGCATGLLYDSLKDNAVVVKGSELHFNETTTNHTKHGPCALSLRYTIFPKRYRKARVVIGQNKSTFEKKKMKWMCGHNIYVGELCHLTKMCYQNELFGIQNYKRTLWHNCTGMNIRNECTVKWRQFFVKGVFVTEK